MKIASLLAVVILAPVFASAQPEAAERPGGEGKTGKAREAVVVPFDDQDPLPPARRGELTVDLKKRADSARPLRRAAQGKPRVKNLENYLEAAQEAAPAESVRPGAPAGRAVLAKDWKERLEKAKVAKPVRRQVAEAAKRVAFYAQARRASAAEVRKAVAAAKGRAGAARPREACDSLAEACGAEAVAEADRAQACDEAERACAAHEAVLERAAEAAEKCRKAQQALPADGAEGARGALFCPGSPD